MRVPQAIFGRRTGRCAAFAACAFALPVIAQNAPADPGEVFVDSLYNERVRAVQKTRGVDDDLELAAEMLDIAPTLPGEEPDARSALYARVVAVVKHAEAGYETALAAIQKLAEHRPGHPAAQAQAALDLYAAWYRSVDRDEREAVAKQYIDRLVAAADAAMDRGNHAQAKDWYSEASSVQRVTRLELRTDLRARLADARAMELAEREADQLKLLATRSGLTPERARRLIVLLAVEMGRPGEALVYAEAANNPEFVQGLDDVAATYGTIDTDAGDEDRPPQHWYRVGTWYAAMIDEPRLSDRAMRRSLEHARNALSRFIDQTRQENVEKARATILLRQVQSRLDELGGDEGAETDTIDILAMLDPRQHMLRGQPFRSVENKLMLPESSIMHLPVAGGEHYTLTFQVEIAGGDSDAIVLWLPVAGRMARMHIDTRTLRRTQINGIGPIPGSERTMRLERGQPAEIAVEVTTLPANEAALRVFFNGRQMWTWRGAASHFTDPDYGKPPDERHFAIRAGDDAMFSKIELHLHGPE